MSYEMIDHTGDLGISVRAPTLEELFAESARAMFEIMIEIPRRPPASTETFPVPGNEPAEALRDLLAELLYRFTVNGRLYTSFTAAPGKLMAGSEPFDPARHKIRTELKAVTYHQLEAVRETDGWRARIIFDV